MVFRFPFSRYAVFPFHFFPFFRFSIRDSSAPGFSRQPLEIKFAWRMAPGAGSCPWPLGIAR